MATGEQESERTPVEVMPVEVAPVEVPGRELTGGRSEDGRARIEVASGSSGGSEVGLFHTQRSDEGVRSAHELMDQAQAAGVLAPAELRKSFASHPEVIDLLQDEPASARFWGERSAADRVGDGVGDAPGAAGGGEAGDLDEARALAERMAEDAERRAEVASFEPPERWIGDINAPGRDWPGRDENCVFCGLATEMRWRGSPVQAGEWRHGTGVTQETVDELVGPLKETSASEIDRALSDAGPGASGIVVIEQRFSESHMINAVNDRGQVRWLDGQVGTVEGQPPGHAVGFHWNGRDREGRPL